MGLESTKTAKELSKLGARLVGSDDMQGHRAERTVVRLESASMDWLGRLSKTS